MKFFRFPIFVLAMAGVFMTGCVTTDSAVDGPSMELAEYVDLERFMGTWFVHGYTPTAIDRVAFNSTETYELADNGRILTTYRFSADSIYGQEKVFTPSARVVEGTNNAEWRMRFFGVINAAYLILYVSEDYDYTVIGHPGRELAWIMSRSSQIDETRYMDLKAELVRRDFDLVKFQRVEHRGTP